MLKKQQELEKEKESKIIQDIESAENFVINLNSVRNEPCNDRCTTRVLILLGLLIFLMLFTEFIKHKK